MLKYLLSTLCIFLFFEDVRLSRYKCASPDCSVFISRATVTSFRPPNSEHEVAVEKGKIVHIYGIDTEKNNYLVKVKGSEGLHLLPRKVLKEEKNILQKAIYDVEDPFQQNQLPRVSTKETSCINERFNSIVLNIKSSFDGEKISTDLVDQPSSVEDKEIEPVTGAASESEDAKENETVENGTASATNKASSNPEANANGTENVISKPTQVDSTADNQTNSNGTEGDDVSIEEVEEDLTEQQSESNVTESVTETKNSSDSQTQTSTTSSVNSSDLPPQKSVGQSDTNPKVAFGDTPGAVLPAPTSPNNLTSDDNETVGIGNESSKTNPSDEASLNKADHEIDPLIGSQRDTISVVSEPDNSTLNSNDTVKAKDIGKVDEKEALPESTPPDNSENRVPHSLIGVKRSGSASENKSGQSNKTESADSVQQKKENAGMSKFNTSNQYESANMATSTVQNEEKPPLPVENKEKPIPPVLNEEKSTPPVLKEEKPTTPVLNEEKPSSPVQNEEKPTPLVQHKEKPTPPVKNKENPTPAVVNEEKPSPPVENDEKTPPKIVQHAAPPGSISSSSGKLPTFDYRKPLVGQVPVKQPGLPNKNASPDSDKSAEEKLTQERPSPASPESNLSSSTSKPLKSDDHKSVDPAVAEKLEPSTKKESDSDANKLSMEASTKTEDAVPQIPTVDPLNGGELESDSLQNQIDAGAKPDSSPEQENESTPPSFPNTPPKNINDVSADHQAYDGSKHGDQTLEEAIFKEESAFYTDIFGYVGNFSSLFENVAVLQSYLNFEWLQKRNDTSEQQHCDEESCPAFSIFDSMAKYGFDMSAINLQSWSLLELHQSKQTSLVAGILLCTVLLFTTLISILRNSKKKSRISTLISVVNQLEKKLLVATKEISLLEEQLTDAPVALISQPAAEVDYESGELLHQIELLQVRNTDLEDKVTYLEKELHNVTTSAFEMHKLLENSLSTQAQSRLAEDEVDTLRALTERQDRQIDDLMKEMDAIVTENRYLKDDLKKMEKETSSLTKKNLELSEKNRNLSLRLDQQIEESSTIKSNYKSEIYQLQAKIEDLEINLRRSEFQVESLNRAFMDKHENKSDDQMQALQDDVQLKLQLSTLKAMNNELSAELKEQKNARRTLDDHIGDVIRKCNELTQALEVSEKGRSEAVNKLQVLTDYFNEKESQLQKEISAKEKLFMESENKDQLLSQKLSSLKEEIKNNKDRNEELKKEIEAQERSFKTQLATAEQKSRDLWFALRQAERKYQESEKEAATLRNKILILENNLSSANQKLNEKHSTNGDINGQPLMFSAEMLSYRGPSDFIPPPPSPLASHSPEFFPPEPSYSPDERLPPLGGRRVPSPPSLIVPPPEDDDFKPPLPHAQYMPGRSRHDSLNMSYYGDSPQYN